MKFPKPNYYLVGSLIGLLTSLLSAAFILRRDFYNLLIQPSDNGTMGLIPVLCGAGIAIASSWILDKKVSSNGFFKAGLLLPCGIFILGTVFGSVVNWMVIGQFRQFFDWAVKPMYWIGLFGVPASLFVGCLYYLLRKIIL